MDTTIKLIGCCAANECSHSDVRECREYAHAYRHARDCGYNHISARDIASWAADRIIADDIAIFGEEEGL